MSSGQKGVGVHIPGRFSLGVVAWAAAWAAIAASQVGCADNGDAREHARPTAAVASGPSTPDPLATIGCLSIAVGYLLFVDPQIGRAHV